MKNSYIFFNKILPNQKNLAYIDGENFYHSLNYNGRFNEWFNRKIKKVNLIENVDFFKEKSKNNKIKIYLNIYAIRKILDLPKLDISHLNILKKEPDLKNLINLLEKFFEFDKIYIQNNNQTQENLKENNQNIQKKFENENKLKYNKCVENINDFLKKVENQNLNEKLDNVKAVLKNNKNELNFDENNENLMNKFNIYFLNSENKKTNKTKTDYIYEYNHCKASEVLYSFILIQIAKLDNKTPIGITDLWLNIKKYFTNPQQIHNINSVIFYKIQVFLNIQHDISQSITEKYLFNNLIDYFNFFFNFYKNK